MNVIISAVPEYVITVVISTAIFYAFKRAQNLIHVKVLHAKTAQSKEAWSLLEQVANTAVSSLAGANLPGQDKFTKATGLVQTALADQGIKNVDLKAIDAAVQAAYEKSPLTPYPKTESTNSDSGEGIQPGTVKAIEPTKEAN